MGTFKTWQINILKSARNLQVDFFLFTVGEGRNMSAKFNSSVGKMSKTKKIENAGFFSLFLF